MDDYNISPISTSFSYRTTIIMGTASYLLRTLADINELHFIIEIASLLGYVARNPTTNVDKLQSTFDILIEADTKLKAVEQTSRTTTNPNLESITRDLIKVEETLLKAMGQIDPAIEQHVKNIKIKD